MYATSHLLFHTGSPDKLCIWSVWVGIGILSRYRYSVFFSVFLKVGTVFGIGIAKYRGIGIGISEFVFHSFFFIQNLLGLTENIDFVVMSVVIGIIIDREAYNSEPV